MIPDHERFADWDAAYVLGALTPADRRDYEAHLEECERCRRAVAELAPIPGLLARVPPERAASAGDADDDAGPPADLVDLVVARRARRIRSFRRRIVLASAAAAVVVAAVIAVPLALGAAGGPARGAAETVALSAIDGTPPITASVRLASVAWGTRISMECSYEDASAWGGGDGPWGYALVVVDESGEESQVATWNAVPGRTIRLEGASAVPLEDIAGLEVRTLGGRPVLEGDR